PLLDPGRAARRGACAAAEAPRECADAINEWLAAAGRPAAQAASAPRRPGLPQMLARRRAGRRWRARRHGRETLSAPGERGPGLAPCSQGPCRSGRTSVAAGARRSILEETVGSRLPRLAFLLGSVIPIPASQNASVRRGRGER